MDPNGNAIVGAKLTAKNSATGQMRDAATGDDGAYVLAELPAGEYAVTAEYGGLSPVGQNVIVNVGSDTTANFDLTRVEKRLGSYRHGRSAGHRYHPRRPERGRGPEVSCRTSPRRPRFRQAGCAVAGSYG